MTDATLLDKLNTFFARFEDSSSKGTAIITPQSESGKPPTLRSYQVKHVLSRINVKKASGPDGVSGWVLKPCADQLARYLHLVFQTNHCTSCLKATTIIPVPESSPSKSLDDFINNQYVSRYRVCQGGGIVKPSFKL